MAGDMHHGQFTFNDPSGACPTCAGIGTAMRVHPALLVPDPTRSLNDGAFVKAALSNSRDSWGGRILHSLSAHYGFSLDTPFQDLAQEHVDLLLYGTKGEQFEVVLPPGAKQGQQHVGKKIKFSGVVNQLEHHYRWYRKQGTSNAGMDEYLKKVMVEYDCPECGGARLKRARRLVTVNNRNLYEVGEMHLVELLSFLKTIKPTPRQRAVAQTIMKEMTTRLELLIAIGLDYLSLNRRSSTLSGGESQRIRLSSQIGSGLMGMLYVLDEPSIGLHPKDNVKMIETLGRLRDLGNTVIVVEHDADTIRAADHVIEIGPGPGVHGGKIVVDGPLKKILNDSKSITGEYLSGKRTIAVPAQRRPSNGKVIFVRGARQNNLKNVDVEIPLEQFVCVTGASGSGKSSLIHEIVQKQLYSVLHDSRVLAGDHDATDGTRTCQRCDQRRSITDRPVVPLEPGDVHRHSTTRFASCSPKPRKQSDAGSPRRPSASTSKAAVAKNAPAKARSPRSSRSCRTSKSRARHAKVRATTRTRSKSRYHGKSIADVLEMSIEDGVWLLRRSTEHRPQDQRVERTGPGLSQARPSVNDSVRRRSPTRQTGRGAGKAEARKAQPLHP